MVLSSSLAAESTGAAVQNRRFPDDRVGNAPRDPRLDEAERLVEAENFGAVAFFASRAGRITRNTIEEAREAESKPGARAISGSRVNLREGPSTRYAVLTVLLLGTPVFPGREEEDWILVRTTGGSVGWVRRSLIR